MSSFDSVSEMFVPPSTLWKTRKWHWISGDVVNIDWNVTIAGSGAVTPNDTINGGYLVNAISGGPELNYNLIRHYDFNGCIWLAEVQQITTTAQNLLWGMTAANRLPAMFNGVIAGSSTSIFATNWRFTTNDGGASNTDSDTGVAFDALIHSHQLELNGSNATYKLDGVLIDTITTTLPTAALQPIAFADGVAKSYRIRQIEAYNT